MTIIERLPLANRLKTLESIELRFELEDAGRVMALAVALHTWNSTGMLKPSFRCLSVR